MVVQTLDTRGLRCPIPAIKITILAIQMKPGDVLDVLGDCPTFEEDVRAWCSRSKKIMLWIREEGKAKRCQIQF